MTLIVLYLCYILTETGNKADCNYPLAAALCPAYSSRNCAAQSLFLLMGSSHYMDPLFFNHFADLRDPAAFGSLG